MTHSEQIFVCAVRYGLGRESYVTAVIADFMIAQKLSESCKNVIKYDIENCKDYGMDCDKEEWMKLLKHLSEN